MIEAMKQWLEALEKSQSALAEELSAWDIDPPLHHVQESHDLCGPAITSLRQAIAELESQEPVAWRYGALLYHDKLDAMEFIRTSGDSYLLEPLYTQPQRTWVGLTDEDAEEVWQSVQASDFHDCVQPFAQGIEQALKEKNA